MQTASTARASPPTGAFGEFGAETAGGKAPNRLPGAPAGGFSGVSGSGLPGIEAQLFAFIGLKVHVAGFGCPTLIGGCAA